MQASISESASAQRPQIYSLTSLRFVAAMTVVLYHYFSLSAFSLTDGRQISDLDPISRWLGEHVHALTDGYMAVGFFFILSGFVLARAHFQQLADGRFEYGRFLKRRFSRIYPLHFLVTIAFGGLFLLSGFLGISVNNPENFTWPAFLSNIFLLRGLNFIGRLTFNGPAWYVSSQFHLYLLFPILGWCVLRSPLKSIPTLIVAILFFLGMYFGFSSDNLLTQRTYDYGILRAVAEFPIGLAMYRVYHDYEQSGATFIRPRHVIGAGLTVFLTAQLGLEDALIILLLAALIFISAAAELHFEMTWLTHPWLVYGGKISYAIYLIHIPFLACVHKAFPRLGVSNGSTGEGILLAACVILLLPIAAFVCRWIERPASAWTWNVLTHSGKGSLSAA
jgi:peptidoglycan/LPS O-acetylase OafA/YrhL